MKRLILLTLIALIAVPIFAATEVKPVPFPSLLFDAPDGQRTVKVGLGDRLPHATLISFHVEVFDSTGAKIGQFGANATVSSKVTPREVFLALPNGMRAAKAVRAWASAYRARNTNEVIQVAFPPGCRTFCMVGRNECNLACAEGGGNVAFYACYADEEGCYYDCFCH
jgi:hypothetical protein